MNLSMDGKEYCFYVQKIEKKNKVSAIDVGLKDFAIIVDSQGKIQKALSSKVSSQNREISQNTTEIAYLTCSRDGTFRTYACGD